MTPDLDRNVKMALRNMIDLVSKHLDQPRERLFAVQSDWGFTPYPDNEPRKRDSHDYG